MKHGSHLALSVLVSTVLLGARVDASEEPAIEIRSSTPSVVLAPRTYGRFIRLPSLEIEFKVRPSCPRGSQPQSVTLSVADTRKSIGVENLTARQISTITLQVPGKQIAPIAAADFCRISDDDRSVFEGRELTFADALTAHASLRCSADSDDSITYVSHALNVNIRCEEDDTEALQADSDGNE